ncbi:radical SAM family heme chaperone HemW [Flagellimonas allohymeniacidonis]|uniref:Heme chaperone HemW n=1 Tax=Flagellimonas allohymeniacidonis TaxID=2517819 RepID=A0A4Q8QBZ8_9FLAO|nr:radical SAM family heme chaperone HemW [Allomuricauda hymeniacidonis]TAI47174.1 radical SAM family heme chaperone HemW [Allomuricauda hymeniacidonis]
MAGIYLHIPFCKQACHYCDFHFSTQMRTKEAMLKALQRELKLRKDELEGEAIETIYFGGGTPSVLEVSEIEALIAAVQRHYHVIQDAEVTLEANPDDLSNNRIIELSKSPINRLSIGIQSFFDADLQLMNRAHNAREAEECVKKAQEYFENISIDLIYGIPGADNDRWKANIEKALALQVPHISSYALTVEPRTALKKFIEKGLVPEMDDEQAQEQFHMLLDMLENEGFVNYEISNFGKEGFFSKNNTSYWQGKKYLGIGPSAHSFDGEVRSWNIRNNIKYIKALELGELPLEREALSVRDRYNEYVMTGLRTIWGVSFKKVRTEFGEPYESYLKGQSEKYIKEHLLFVDEDRLLATKKGKFLVDGIASDLFMVNLVK